MKRMLSPNARINHKGEAGSLPEEGNLVTAAGEPEDSEPKRVPNTGAFMSNNESARREPGNCAPIAFALAASCLLVRRLGKRWNHE